VHEPAFVSLLPGEYTEDRDLSRQKKSPDWAGQTSDTNIANASGETAGETAYQPSAGNGRADHAEEGAYASEP
jgi:hypothetical protein